MIVKNAKILDYRGSAYKDIQIKDGKIAKIGNIEDFDIKDERIIDGKSKVLMPSFVDLHVHFRYPGFTYKEDILTGSKAAVKGGYTICNTMANTKPVVDTLDVYEKIMDKNDEVGLIDLYQIIAVTKGMQGEELIDFSIIPDKQRFVSDDGKGILSNDLMYKACVEAKKYDKGIMVHAEDPSISSYDYRAAEDLITIRDIYLSKLTGARIHMCHVSTEDSIAAVRLAKELGLNVTCEVTPHHIALADLDFRVNPPIRERKDIEAILEGIKDGTVDAIATDHAPHSVEDKEKGAPGSIGLETSFAVSYTNLVKTGIISLEELSKIMSYSPAQILGHDHGIIEVGKSADLVLVDLESTSQIDDNYFESKSKNSVFKGMDFDSSIVMTIRKGELVYEDNRQTI